jgi:hypothetical protein
MGRLGKLDRNWCLESAFENGDDEAAMMRRKEDTWLTTQK